jgi:hypothetical protein
MKEYRSMPLKLNVGVSRKIGLPEYSSAGASLNLELELEASLLDSDPEGFHKRVQAAYREAQQAVVEEIARLHDQTNGAPATPRGAPVEHAFPRNSQSTSPTRTNGSRTRPPRPATTNQVRAIKSIAARLDADLGGLLREEFGVGRPEELTMNEASRLIDDLKATAER